MDRFFEKFLEPAPEFPTMGDWAPALDVKEGKDALTVTAEVPGVEPGDIRVTVENDMLTIKGEKEQRKEEKDERMHHVETMWGAFIRRVRLPAAVDPGKVNATFKNGVLTVTLPKTAAAKGTMIPVKPE
jgi:HSP20 family protein